MSCSSTTSQTKTEFNSLLTQTHVDDFVEQGFCVVQIFNAEEVKAIRNSLHEFVFQQCGVRHDKLNKQMIERFIFFN